MTASPLIPGKVYLVDGFVVHASHPIEAIIKALKEQAGYSSQTLAAKLMAKFQAH